MSLIKARFTPRIRLKGKWKGWLSPHRQDGESFLYRVVYEHPRLYGQAFFRSNPMTAWQIAIETSGRTGSVALLHGTKLVQQRAWGPEYRTAAVLAPQLDRLLKELRQRAARLGFVSVSQGPGSFTGLRIGVTTAKTLAYALGTPVVGVDTLAIVAHQGFAATPTCRQVVVGLKAYRGQIFVRQQSRGDEIPVETEVWDAKKWKNFLASRADSTPIGGNAMHPEPPRDGNSTDAGWQMPTAAGLGRLAWTRFEQGEAADPFAVMPRYLRPSAAEEQADARGSRE
jgi:tRNA threonylcarbamoyl adenosine modification protein YeaZ